MSISASEAAAGAGASGEAGGTPAPQSGGVGVGGAARDAADGLDARLSALESAVRSAGETLASLERQQVIERALVEARAIAPLTAARALAGALKDRPGVPIEKLVKELRSTRPELFRPAGSGAGARRGGAGVMGPIGAERSGGEATGAARDDDVLRGAMAGDRKSLAEYLRRRRGA